MQSFEFHHADPFIPAPNILDRSYGKGHIERRVIAATKINYVILTHFL